MSALGVSSTWVGIAHLLVRVKLTFLIHLEKAVFQSDKRLDCVVTMILVILCMIRLGIRMSISGNYYFGMGL